jgi:glutaredoxin
MNEQNVSFADVDIINDKDNLREWIKVYSGWKTLPQLFINGEIVGGVDILNELISEGEFLGMIPKENIKGNPKLEIQSILQEEDIILITTSDHESKPDEATYSDFVQKHLQLKALIFRTFDIESKPEIIPIFR